MSIDFNTVQLLKALLPMVFIVLGNVIFVIFVHPEKQLLPINAHPSLISTMRRLVQFLKTPVPILAIPEPMTTSSRLEQPMKASDS